MKKLTVSAGTKSQLPKPVQDLIKMIFDVESMKKAMVEFEVTNQLYLIIPFMSFFYQLCDYGRNAILTPTGVWHSHNSSSLCLLSCPWFSVEEDRVCVDLIWTTTVLLLPLHRASLISVAIAAWTSCIQEVGFIPVQAHEYFYPIQTLWTILHVSHGRTILLFLQFNSVTWIWW